MKFLIYIIMKDMVSANMLKYSIGNRFDSAVSIFPYSGESFTCFEKGQTPDFIIYDPAGQHITSVEFMKIIRSLKLKSKVMFLLSDDDDEITSQLTDLGAVDYLVKSADNKSWINETVQNISFIHKNITLIDC